MPTVSEKVDRLEEVFARFMERTEEALRDQRASNARTDAQLLRNDAKLLEMQQRADRDREVSERRWEENAQRWEENAQRWEEDKQRWERAVREEAEREAKRERERKKYNKQLAEMSDSMGTLIEDIVWPNATRVASELFGTDPVLSIGRRLVRRLPTDAGRHMEIDILASGRQHVMVIEAKRKLDAEKVREFVERLSQLAEFFPETAGLRLMPVIASVTIEESVIAFLNRQKVYGLAMGDETMELVNRGQF